MSTSTRKPKRMWAVMTGQSWNSFTVEGMEIGLPEEGPHGFIPLFDTRAQAVAWSRSGEKHVVEVKLQREESP